MVHITRAVAAIVTCVRNWMQLMVRAISIIIIGLRMPTTFFRFRLLGGARSHSVP